MISYIFVLNYTKGGSKCTQAYKPDSFSAYSAIQIVKFNTSVTQSVIHVNGFVHAKSDCCWSHLAGSCSPQRLFCTKSSVHGISVIKTRWSLTTDIVNSSFYCIPKSCSDCGLQQSGLYTVQLRATKSVCFIVKWEKCWSMHVYQQLEAYSDKTVVGGINLNLPPLSACDVRSGSTTHKPWLHAYHIAPDARDESGSVHQTMAGNLISAHYANTFVLGMNG